MQSTRRRLSVQLSVLLASVCVVSFLIGGAAEAESPPVPPIEYVVAPGDTLWAIAADLVPAGADVRPLISQIKVSSGLTSSDLQPGQVLSIPRP